MTGEPFEPYKCHYFVVGCISDDDGTQHFFIDDETCDSLFPKGSVWNNKIGEWRRPDSAESLKVADRSMFSDLHSRLHA